MCIIMAFCMLDWPVVDGFHSTLIFKVVAFLHWQHLSFTKIHQGPKTKSWTPAEFTVFLKYSSLVYELHAYFLSNTLWLAKFTSVEKQWCLAKFQYMGTENASFSFTCMETYSHNENILELVGESWIRSAYTFCTYFYSPEQH